MKNLLVSFIFILISAAGMAQESKSTTTNNNSQENVSKKEVASIKLSSHVASNLKQNQIVCYSETSKVAFYEALISQNGFNIDLKDSNDFVIGNAEEVISKKTDELQYTEEEFPAPLKK